MQSSSERMSRYAWLRRFADGDTSGMDFTRLDRAWTAVLDHSVRSDEELVVEYRRARALIFCSIYEGFGLPIVEAMHHGCPILCSRGTALAEVAGDAALQVDPLQVGEIEQGMRILASDAALRARLSSAGRARATRYRWSGCARRTIDALDELRA